MLKNITRHSMIVGMLFMLMWCFTACGKKGPPLPPGYPGLPVVNDLHYRIMGDNLTLEWTIPESTERKVYDITGARVYRFKTSVRDAACKDCPLTLVFVTNIPFESRHMNYREALDKGYQYAYQVVLYDQTDQEGEKSNMVDFMYE
jgi:hypothetical protein